MDKIHFREERRSRPTAVFRDGMPKYECPIHPVKKREQTWYEWAFCIPVDPTPACTCIEDLKSSPEDGAEGPDPLVGWLDHQFTEKLRRENPQV